MAESREEVDAQLVHLTDALQPLVEEEMDELAAMKRRCGAQPCGGGEGRRDLRSKQARPSPLSPPS